MTISTHIAGYGAYLPSKILTNRDLESIIDTSDAWIQSRTGIKQRHIAADTEATSDLATAAAHKALERAEWQPQDVDMIIVATTTPDYTFPATATRVQDKLKAGSAIAFDVQAVCAGFVHALAVCSSMMKDGMAEKALVIGAETFSRILDWSDRSTCVLFGDGAGALALQAKQNNPEGAGIIKTLLRAQGTDFRSLYVDGGASTNGKIGHLRMDGKDVFKKAVTRLADISQELLDQQGLDAQDIDWFIPHQANQRIVDALGRKLRIPAAKIATTIASHANTSAASIPLVIDSYGQQGHLKPGQLLLMQALGGGISWGACLVRY
ncbi:MAG: ketoacyl-ACP synthase III [Alphaproteobacteria bacterium GM202ARS2]|nr:ketoacyl-ACP synthase III [Alphaproteobacteria bacterium GM202ARS2]